MMTKYATTVDPEIHDLTRAEIARQIRALVTEREQITSQRAALYQRSSNGGSSLLSVDEKAARSYAKFVLGGVAPAELEPPASEFDHASMDRQFAAKQRGLDIAIRILGNQELAARAAEAVAWAETHAAKWRNLVRETIMAAARLEALERAAADVIAQCPDISAISWPLTNLVGTKERQVSGLGYTGFMPVTPDDLIEAGLAAGIVQPREIDKARNV
jgi:hypothetical protein